MAANEAYLTRSWKSRFKSLDSPKLRTATEEMMKVEVIVPLILKLGTIQVSALSGAVET